jgi:hypothetical protein
MENIDFIIVPTNIGIEIYEHTMKETLDILIELIIKNEWVEIKKNNNIFICKNKYQNIFLIDYDIEKNDFDNYYYIILYYQKIDKLFIDNIIQKISKYLYSRTKKHIFFLFYIELKYDYIYTIYNLYFQNDSICSEFVKNRINYLKEILYNKTVSDNLEPLLKKIKIIY